MVRASIVTLAFCLLATAPHAEPTAEEKTACEADYKKYCSTVPETKAPEIIACLKLHADKVSEQCRKKLADKR